MTAAVSLPQYGVRAGTDEDHPYILKSWVESNMRTQAAKDAGRVYLQEHRTLVARLLTDRSHSTPELRIAHLADDPGAIMGFCCFELGPKPCIHYCYVREGVRQQGIATMLLPVFGRDVAVQFSHKPSLPGRFEAGAWQPGIKVPATWIYNPYRAYT